MTSEVNVENARRGPIVVGVDLSDASGIAITQAGFLAKATGLELLVAVNVNIPERAVIEDLMLAEKGTFEDAGHELLRRMAALYAPGVETRQVMTFRDSAADGLLDVVADTDASMLVVASHGRSGMKRWLLGSVAEKLARASSVPVMIVPVGERVAETSNPSSGSES